MFSETELTQKARARVNKLLQDLDESRFRYHNMEHTQSVVEAAIEIGQASHLTSFDLESVVVAAWFHDTGFLKDPRSHEEYSIQYAKEFLEENQVNAKTTHDILGCIQATRMPQNPTNLLEQVMCDADLYKLGTKEFFDRTDTLREELFCCGYKDVTTIDWDEESLHFLKQHQYFTAYAKSALQPRKEKNIKKLKKRIKGEAQEAASEPVPVKKEKSREENKPGRGVETMFRTTSANHLELSGIADQKANIMISVNAIIVSLLVSVLFRKFEEFPNLIVPTAILTTSSLISIVFAILATRPNVSSGTFTKEDVINQRTNLLFFGNFHRMDLKDYEWGMSQLLKDPELLYSSMIHDIYFLGRVLGRKYRLIRISYTVFMFGFVISVMSFAIALIFFPVE